jgi:rubrerythrin
MVTMTGTQTYFQDALKDLVELDYDAVEAYDAAIDRLENEKYKEKLTEFKQDHSRHIRELSEILRKHGDAPPTSPSAKQWLTKGKVIIANLVGDTTILRAMLSNEEDTNTAYDRIDQRTDKWPDAAPIIQRGREDEHKHKSWLEKTLETA